MRQKERWLLVGILLLAFALRLLALDNFAPGLRYDELQNHLMANRVLAGERPLYFAESWGHEPLYHYAQAFFLGLSGQSDWSLRITSVYTGLLAVAAIWLVGRRLFDRRVGLLAAAITAVAFWAIFYSRIGCRVGTTTLFITLAAYFLWQIWARPAAQKWQGWLAAAAGGVCTAVGVYVYVAGRMSFGLLLLFTMYVVLFHRRQFRQLWPRFVLYGFTAVLLVMPLFVILQQFPALEQRLDLINQPLNALRAGNPLPVLALTQKAWGMYIIAGERDWLYNVYGRPIFDVVTAVFFLLGLGLALWRWRHPQAALLLIWLLAGTAPAMLATPEASLTHTIAAQPAAFLLLAGGITWVWRHADRRNTWFGPTLAGGLLLYWGILSAHAYFITWNRNPEVRELYQGGITAVADEITAHPPPGPIAIGGPYINYWHPWNTTAFDLAMTTDVSQTRWFNPAGGWVWPAADTPVTYYFPTNPLGAQSFHPFLADLFSADAVPLPVPDDDFLAYRLDEPAALTQELVRLAGTESLAWPPELAHLPPPEFPLLWDNQLAMIAVDVPSAVAHPGDAIQFITYWQVQQTDPSPLVAFTHLTRDGQEIWGQQDWLDVRMAGLQTGDRFAQVHQISISPDTPPGMYHLQIGLYGPDTLVRLPLLPVADRVWVGDVTVEAAP